MKRVPWIPVTVVLCATVLSVGCERRRLTPCLALAGQVAAHAGNMARASGDFPVRVEAAVTALRALELPARLDELRNEYVNTLQDLERKHADNRDHRDTMVGVSAATVKLLDNSNLVCAGER